MENDWARRAYGLGPAVVPAPKPPSPLWVRTEQARREYKRVCIAFSNQEATETELLTAARALRALQEQWRDAT